MDSVRLAPESWPDTGRTLASSNDSQKLTYRLNSCSERTFSKRLQRIVRSNLPHFMTLISSRVASTSFLIYGHKFNSSHGINTKNKARLAESRSLLSRDLIYVPRIARISLLPTDYITRTKRQMAD